MNAKTDSSPNHGTNNELSAPFRFWLYGLTILTLLLVFLTNFNTAQAYRESRDWGFHLTLMPWIEATRITLVNGFDVFSGVPLSPPTDAQRLTMLVGLLLSLVVGPALLLLGLRISRQKPETARARSYGLMLSLMLGGILAYAVAIPSVPVALIQWRVSNSLREAQEQGEQRDQMIGSVGKIVRKAREFRLLPVTFGGGGGSFNGYALSDALAKNEFGTYRVESSSDSLLVVRATPVSSQGQSIVATLEPSGSLRYRFEDTTRD